VRASATLLRNFLWLLAQVGRASRRRGARADVVAKECTVGLNERQRQSTSLEMDIARHARVRCVRGAYAVLSPIVEGRAQRARFESRFSRQNAPSPLQLALARRYSRHLQPRCLRRHRRTSVCVIRLVYSDIDRARARARVVYCSIANSRSSADYDAKCAP